jgi:molecular chaperone GrpE
MNKNTNDTVTGPGVQSGPAPERDTNEATTQAERTEARMGNAETPEESAKQVDETSPATDDAAEAEVVTGEIVVDEPMDANPMDTTNPMDTNPMDTKAMDGKATDTKAGAKAPGSKTEPLGAELEALRSELDERTRDLQRVSAEYANYRKRVDRDRSVVVEQAMGLVISALLPVLDDLDRARDHDDLVGPSAAMAEQLNAALAKFGLTGFGEVGDAFDPTRHEAVAHQTSADVTAPTCVAVMRRGYLLGDRLLRAALVAVADPE